MSCMPTGAELFVRTLADLGIRELFTLVGDHLNDVLPAAASAGFRIVDMRHESGVTHAADAWARIHRRPAVSLVTGGPGHTNALTGIAGAYLACSPLIAVSGSRASTMAERGAFQDINQLGMTTPVVKWSGEPPNAAQIPFYLRRAYQEANSGRRGPVALNIPVDIFAAQAAEQSSSSAKEPTATSHPQVDQAIALLRSAKRPVVIAGSGVWWADAGAELEAFIEKTRLPLYTITFARGMVSDEHPLCMGYGDPALNRAALTAFREADVVLVLGKRIDYRMAFGGPRLFDPEAKFIQVDIHQSELGINRPIDFAIHADIKAALQALIDAAGKSHWRELPWIARVKDLRADWGDHLLKNATGLHPASLFARLKNCLPADILYSWDGGDFVHWGRAILPARHSGGWLRLGPLGAIGSALPNAVALKMAHPDRPVAMITGDGSLGFYLAELDTLVRHKLPVVIIVGNDGGWGLERELQQEAKQNTVACELAHTRYDLIMKGFGGDGETITSIDQVQPAIQRAFASNVPYLLNVMIEAARSPFTEWQIDGKKRK